MFDRRFALGALAFSAIAAAAIIMGVPSDAKAERPAPKAAEDFVSNLAADAINTLSGQTSEAARLAKFKELLDQGFEMETIGLLVLGGARRDASPEQLATYQTSFRKFVVAKYASLLNSYQGEQFTVTGSAEAGKKDRSVSSTITPPTGEPVTAQWRVRQFGSDLKIIDVKLEGISMVQSQRDEFASILSSGGLDNLISILDKQTAELS